ncbi:beta-lactamase family protein [Burkholderiaceae bacterium DAT-1]|nr:beta-lactamase family protein [Burkholderiaceae bacterium DAT-1]
MQNHAHGRHHSLIHASLASLLLLIGTGLAAAAPQSALAADQAAIDASALGKSIVDHINRDTPDAMRLWAPKLFSDAMDAGDRADAIKRLVASVRESGGLDILESGSAPGQPGVAMLEVKSRRTGKQAMMILTADEKRAGTLIGADLVPMEDPARYANWPAALSSLHQLPDLIDPVLASLVKDKEFSGCITVSNGKEAVYNACRGLADRNQGTPVGQQTRFHIGSMNKMFTAVAIAQLVEAGKLSWHASVADVLPDYPDQATARKMTVWQLLHHTAGLGDYFVPEFFAHREQFVNPADYLPLIAKQTRVGEPGEQWIYSNAGYILLGRIIERLTDQSYFDYIQAHIFAPAGMSASGYDSQEDITPDLAVGYFHETPFSTSWKANWMTLPFKGSPAGGGYSNNADLLRFAAALKHGKLIQSHTLTQMFDNQVPAGPGGYAAGFGDREHAGRHIRGHAGGAPGMTANLAMVWGTGLSVAITSNQGDDQETMILAERIADVLAASPLSAR